MKTFEATTSELAEMIGVDKTIAYGLIKFLETQGTATIKEVRPNPRGKGKGSNVYVLPDEVKISLKK